MGTVGIRGLAVCLLVLGSCGKGGEPTDYERELARIEATLRETARAPDTLSDAIRRIHDLYLRASLTGDFHHFKEVEEEVDRALSHHPSDRELHLYLAHFDFKLHRWDRVELALGSFADDAEDPAVRVLQADLAFQEGRSTEAEAAYEELTAEVPRWDNLARLAYFRSKSGDLAAAERLYDEARGLLSAKEMRFYAWLELQKGVMDLEHGRPAEALAHFRQANVEYSGYWLIEEHLAEALALVGRTGEAVSIYRELIEKTRDPAFPSALAAILEESDRAEAENLYAEAERRFDERTRLYPEATVGHRVGDPLARREIIPAGSDAGRAGRFVP